jgi:titin
VVPSKSNAFTDTSVAPQTSYTYEVRATNDYYASAWSNTASVTTTAALVVAPPAAPTGLKVLGSSSNKVSLAWVDQSSNETAFEVYRQSGSGAWTLVAVLAPNTTFYQDRSVSPGTSYQYQVRAANDDFASAFTNSVSVTTVVAPPAAPTGLTASAVSSTQIKLQWTDHSTNETAFEVYRQSGTGSWTLVAVLPPGSTSYTDKSVVANTSYRYRVRAANDVWASAFTNEASAQTPPAP